MPSTTDPTEFPATPWELVERAARLSPAATAVRQGTRTLTFGELADRVLTAAHRLRTRLPADGEGTVGLLFENTLEGTVALLGALRAGVPLTPLEPDSTESGLLGVHRDLGPLHLIGHMARLRTLTSAASPDRWQGGVLVDVRELTAPADATARPASLPAPPPDAHALYQYTSGSTGEPRAAVHSQRDLVSGGAVYAHTYAVTPADRLLAAVPLLHSFGMVAALTTALHARAELVLLGRFTPADMLRTMHGRACTIVVGTPLAYDLAARSAASWRETSRPGETVRLCLSSGAALPPEVADRFTEHCGPAVQQVYGSTEAGVIAAQLPQPDGTADAGVGKPVRGVRIRLVDEADRPVPPGGTGALLVRTPAMFTRYLGHPGASERAFRDGWYVTGDLARLDGEGRLHLVGRKDSFVNVGGKKVNPLEVEAVLLAHPGVAEAVVWGEPVEGQASERVRAAVVPRSPLSTAAITAHCRDRLLAHQVPATIACVASLPRTSLGKIRRAAVAATAPAPDRDDPA
ncbi:class I adenylate-forming enzyme family protein [Streptomyces sp. NPDC051597]|uniref:class I adenylate-forming enzyme family protein n=1 Tax=Streptomyces sp. NPDC051597 TaxID=3155049 RepID=UPI003449A00A